VSGVYIGAGQTLDETNGNQTEILVFKMQNHALSQNKKR